MQFVFGVMEEMVPQIRPTDIVYLSAGIDDPPEGWAKHFRSILNLGACERPKLVGFGFHGFEDDERELFEIPEVREWTRKLVDEDFGSLRALMDESRVNGRERPLAAQALGRCKLLALAGYGKHEWHSADKGQGYSVTLTLKGNALLTAMARDDCMEMVALAQSSRMAKA